MWDFGGKQLIGNKHLNVKALAGLLQIFGIRRGQVQRIGSRDMYFTIKTTEFPPFNSILFGMGRGHERSFCSRDKLEQ